jgi:hypothetical protein
LVIGIYPSTWLRVVSLSNHLLFVIWSCKNHCKSGPVRFYEDEHEYEEEEEYEIAVMLLVVLVVVLVLVLGFSSN